MQYPRRYYLNKEWERNRGSMLGYLQQVHRGLKGLVTSSSCTVLYCTVLYCTVLYCTVLYRCTGG